MEAYKAKGSLEAKNRMRWNPQSRKIMMERNLSPKTREIQSKENT
jgi:hypothetical protein